MYDYGGIVLGGNHIQPTYFLEKINLDIYTEMECHIMCIKIN